MTSSQSEKFSFYTRRHKISLDKARKIAVCDEQGREYILEENVYCGKTVTPTLNSESCWRWGFVGITEGNVKLLSRNMNALSTTKRNHSYQWPGSFGWVLDSSTREAKCGKTGQLRRQSILYGISLAETQTLKWYGQS